MVAQLVPAVVLLVMFYCGKFAVKPKLSQLFKKPIKETWDSVKTGAAAFISAISGSFPGLFFQKFLGSACKSRPGEEGTELFNRMMAVYNAHNRILQIVIALFLGITSGFLPAGSFAWASKRYKRLLVLLFHMVWLVVAIAAAVEVVLFSAARPIGKTFQTNDLFLDRFKTCVLPVWLCMFANTFQYCATNLLQAMKWQISAFIVTILTQLLMWPSMSCALHFTEPEDDVRMFYSCLLNDICSGIVSIPFVTIAIIHIKRRIREPESSESPAPTTEEVPQLQQEGVTTTDLDEIPPEI